MTKRGKLLILAGPSAVGKGTLATYILENFKGFHLSVSATTREPRPGEIPGESYFFLTKSEFEKSIAKGEMLEWAKVHGNHYYGTPIAPVLEALSRGQTVILEIDVQGAKQVKSAHPDAISVFVRPPTFEDLALRLHKRGTESPEQQAIRLQTAKEELSQADGFDYAVINDEVARCANEVVELLSSQ